MNSVSPRAFAALLWTATCVAVAGVCQLIVSVGARPVAAPARGPAQVEWLATAPDSAQAAGPSAPAAAYRDDPVPAPPPAPVAQVAAEALGRISYPWQRLGYQIVFTNGHPGLRGLTLPASHRIEIFVTPGESVEFVEHVIAHEIGHAVDFTYNDSARRSRWLQGRGIGADTVWFGCSGCEDFSTPAGDFAETFAYWQVGDADYSRMAPAPDAASLASLTPLFWPSPPPAAARPAPPPPPPSPPPASSKPSLLCLNSFCTG